MYSIISSKNYVVKRKMKKTTDFSKIFLLFSQNQSSPPARDRPRFLCRCSRNQGVRPEVFQHALTSELLAMAPRAIEPLVRNFRRSRSNLFWSHSIRKSLYRSVGSLHAQRPHWRLIENRFSAKMRIELPHLPYLCNCHNLQSSWSPPAPRDLVQRVISCAPRRLSIL